MPITRLDFNERSVSVFALDPKPKFHRLLDVACLRGPTLKTQLFDLSLSDWENQDDSLRDVTLSTAEAFSFAFLDTVPNPFPEREFWRRFRCLGSFPGAVSYFHLQWPELKQQLQREGKLDNLASLQPTLSELEQIYVEVHTAIDEERAERDRQISAVVEAKFKEHLGRIGQGLAKLAGE